MFVRMLTSMAGDSFSHAYGDIVEVTDTIGKAWIEAGIAEKPPAAAVSEKAAKDAKRKVVELTEQLTAAQDDHKAAAGQAQQLAEQLADLSGRLQVAETDVATLREQNGLLAGRLKEADGKAAAAGEAAGLLRDHAAGRDAEVEELTAQVVALTAERDALAAQLAAATAPKAG